MVDTKKLLSDFMKLSHEDKYNKVLVYLDIIRQNETELLWLFWLVKDIWLEITDDMLVEIYTNLVSLIHHEQIHKFDDIKQKLEQQVKIQNKYKEEEKSDINEADSLLQSI